MYKKTILIVPALLCLYLRASAQQKIEPFYIGDRVPDLPLHRIINYKDSTATLSSFGDKLVILDFWNIHCGICIEQFPKEDSLQRIFRDKLQFILVTADPQDKVALFINRWNKIHNAAFKLPIVCNDSTLFYLFRHSGLSHYVWLAPDGHLAAQTGAEFINRASLAPVMDSVLALQNLMRKSGFSKQVLCYPAPSQGLLNFLSENKFPGL